MIYLDYAASSPIRTCALDALSSYYAENYLGANPNSVHSAGRSAANKLEAARKSLAHSLGDSFRPQELIFVASGTEANNLAIFGLAELARKRDAQRCRVLFSPIEHESVLACAKELRERGFSVELLEVDSEGHIKLESLEAKLRQDVALVSCMYANNETGAIQDVPAFARASHKYGAYFHSDAVHAFCHTALELDDCDAVSVCAHKIGGPVGVGALALRSNLPIEARLFGGGQERGLRSSTQDIAAALAFAAAAEWCTEHREENFNSTKHLSQKLCKYLLDRSEKIHLTCNNYPGVNSLAGIVHLRIDGADSSELLLQLDALGFAVSAGSACSAKQAGPSHVMLAQGLSKAVAAGVLRISFDERVSEDDLFAFADALLDLI